LEPWQHLRGPTVTGPADMAVLVEDE
jgi:hypothetical protein